MKTHHTNWTSQTSAANLPRKALSVFRERLTTALADLRHRLQAHYERLHPDHCDVVREVVAEAEATAWDLSPFPHLVLPDLVEVRMEQLALEPAFARRDDAAFAYAA